MLHELSFALQADELVIMNEGVITHHGACADFATHAALEQVFDQRICVRQLDAMWLAVPHIPGGSETRLPPSSRLHPHFHP